MELNYKKIGEGQSLIILHGLFGSLDNWMTLGKRLGEKYEVWLVDQRNHGHSPHSDKMDYAVMAEDLHDFIVDHQIQDPVVLGHSMGGKTGMEFCMKYPKELSKLVVADMTPVASPNHFQSIIKGLNAVDPPSLTSRKEAEDKMKNHIDEKGIRQFLLKNLHRTEKDQYEWRFNLSVLEKEIDNISSWEVKGSTFEKPTLFMKGGNSNYINEKNIPQIKKLFPKVQISEIEKAGHWLHAEKPDEFYDMLVDFMDT